MVERKQYIELQPGRKPLKRRLAALIFWFLGRGFQAAAFLDANVREEVALWEEESTITLQIDPAGPAMSVGLRGGKFRFLGVRAVESAQLTIYFKNIEAALLVLTGQIGIAQAFAEHRFGIHGDLTLGMSLVRCLHIVEGYLFPGFMVKRIVKEIPPRSRSKMMIYLGTLIGLK